MKMTQTVSSVLDFLQMAVDLPSVKIFVPYMIMIIFSGIWLRKTSAVDLKWVLVIHNFGCCLTSLVTVAGFLVALYANNSLYGKNSTDFIIQVFKLYWFTKIAELLDTVFMILRHRQRQISFLHVYHHASMLLLSDMAYRYYPWPSIATFLGINSCVHVLLYFYYGLTALRPSNPPQWKKEMTQVQIIQFFIGLAIAGYGCRYHKFCVYSILYGLTMITLFSNFYYRAYVAKKVNKREMNGKTH